MTFTSFIFYMVDPALYDLICHLIVLFTCIDCITCFVFLDSGLACSDFRRALSSELTACCRLYYICQPFSCRFPGVDSLVQKADDRGRHVNFLQMFQFLLMHMINDAQNSSVHRLLVRYGQVFGEWAAKEQTPPHRPNIREIAR